MNIKNNYIQQLTKENNGDNLKNKHDPNLFYMKEVIWLKEKIKERMPHSSFNLFYLWQYYICELDEI